MKTKIGTHKDAPVRDEIAYWILVLAKIAHNCFAWFSVVSPNHDRAFTSMEVVTEKNGLRFSTVRRFNGREIEIGSPFFMKREDLIRGLEALDKAVNNDQS